MKKAYLLFSFIFFISNAFAQTKYWQQQTDYKITVSLNDVDHSLSAFESIDYYNNSPDTLTFIWMHLWPNAYKNDRTAFSDQLLKNNRTDFYFSEETKKGYINQLSFKVDNVNAITEDHPAHQDIVKLLLPAPLAPGSRIKIETAFHVKLPYNFSRGGHIGQSYQITQWYPKPAVYDKTGWHEMPYVDQGEFYSEFGSFDVQITLPKNYVVAATGELQTDEEKIWLKEKYVNTLSFKPDALKSKSNIAQKDIIQIPSSKESKTIQFKQENIHDFAWFADKRFNVRQDTLLLKSGRVINLNAYYLPSKNDVWKASISMIKKSILSKSEWVGEYPYNVVSVIDNAAPTGGGMEYPTITLLSADGSEQALEQVINHEVGHNWFYGILGTNERRSPWMDEGMNTYYDKRYTALYAPVQNKPKDFFSKRYPDNADSFFLAVAYKFKKDQPINTTSEKFTERNYELVAYEKASLWMAKLENELGVETFDKVMRTYFEAWKFKHPTVDDFKNVAETISGKSLENTFALLDKKGPWEKPQMKKLKLASFYNVRETNKYNYISVSPSVGFNMYDKFMIGAMIHNYGLPGSNFRFIATPMFAIGSSSINGVARVSYTKYADKFFEKFEIGVNASQFSSNHSLDTSGKKVFENFYKIVPFVKLYFKENNNGVTSWLDFKSFQIGENSFDNYAQKAGSDSLTYYPNSLKKSTRYINQISFNIDNTRKLYPYDYQLQVQQGEGFYRFNASGKYFFNYAKGGGLQVRVFAAAFGLLGAKNNTAFLYQPKLLASNGNDDYTYSSYFLGRTASPAYQNPAIKNTGIAAQQIQIDNGGGLKLRLDQFSGSQGYSQKWVAAVNLNTSLPSQLFPFKLPLKLFLDVGTYSEAWAKTSSTTRFVYVGGLQVSLLKNVLNVYVPLLYSKAFKDQLKTDKELNKLSKKITFSIDIQHLRLVKLLPQVNF